MPTIYANNVGSTLALALGPTDPSLTVVTGEGARFPSPTGGDQFYLTLHDTDGNVEICACTARTGDVLTITRARDDTTAKSFGPGTVVEMRPIAQMFREIDPSTLRGAINGLAPLDATARLPTANLPLAVMTQSASDARYIQITQKGIPNGVAALDASGKIPPDQLPSDSLDTATANTLYIPLTQRAANNGVATLGADGKVPITQLPAAVQNPDMTGYAALAGATFTGDVVFQTKLTTNGLTATGTIQLGVVNSGNLLVTGYIQVNGGGRRGKVTYSTGTPSGTPEDGDEWVQYE